MNSREGTVLRVLIAEDEEPLRLALCELVAGQDGMQVVGAAGSADEAIELAAATKPDVALVGVRMPGGGAEVVRATKDCSPTTRALALSANDDQATVIQMLSAGAVGYVVKGTSPAEILEAVSRAARGQASLSIEAISSMIEELVGDMAERELAEGILRRSEERFRGLVESAPDAVVIVGEDGAVQLVNTETERLFGYTRDELLGLPIDRLLPERFPERHVGYRAGYLVDPASRNSDEFPVDVSLSAIDSDEAEHAHGTGEERFSALLQSAPGGAVVDEGGTTVLVNEQTVGRRKDESEFPIHISLAAIETDQGRLATAFIRDIGERRQGEVAAQLAAIVEFSDDAIISKDLVGTIETWNRGAERMYGYSAEEVVGRSIAILDPPDLPRRRAWNPRAGPARRGRRAIRDEADSEGRCRARRPAEGLRHPRREGADRGHFDDRTRRDGTEGAGRARAGACAAGSSREGGRGGAGPDRARYPRRLHPGDHRGRNAAADPTPQPP